MFFRRLIGREGACRLSSRRFRAGSALAVTFAVLTLAIRLEDYRSRIDDAQLQREIVAQLGIDRNHRLAGGGALVPDFQLRTLRLPSPGSVLVHGLDGALPTHWDFSGWTAISGAPPNADSRLSEGGTIFDLEAIVRLLLGLLAIAAGLDSVTSARFDGRLAALLGQPVSRATIAAGLLIGNALALGASIAGMLMAVVGLLWLGGSGLMTTGMAMSLAEFGAASWVFLATMAAIGMAIGALARREAAGVTIAVSTWVVMSLVGPELTAVLPRLFMTVPGRATLEDELRITYLQKRDAIQRALGDAVVARNPHFTFAPLDEPPEIAEPLNARWLEKSGALRTELEDRETAWDRAESAADASTEWLARLNPAGAFLQTAMAATDTGYSLVERWQEATRQYERQVVRVVYDRPYEFAVVVPGGRSGRVRIVPAASVSDVGEFAVPETRWQDRLARAGWDIVALGVFLIGACAWAIAVFPRPGFETDDQLSSSF